MHVGTNNAEREGTPGITDNYRRLICTMKEVSGILPIIGARGNTTRTADEWSSTNCQKGIGFVVKRR